MTFATTLSPVGGIRTCPLPPKTARTEQLSTTARDQSIRLKRQSQSNSAKWINCQMPDSCQSRRRLQHVMPEPQPNSFGNISQGIPLRRTNRMPLRQARSGRRGRPPCGLGFGNGKRGSITSHKPLGTSAAVITVLHDARRSDCPSSRSKAERINDGARYTVRAAASLCLATEMMSSSMHPDRSRGI